MKKKTTEWLKCKRCGIKFKGKVCPNAKGQNTLKCPLGTRQINLFKKDRGIKSLLLQVG